MIPVCERSFRVRYYECDRYGHVNHANYLRYMQEAAFDASAAVGYPPMAYEEMNRAWLVRDHQIRYLSPLRYGDEIRVKTWVSDFRRVRSRRQYELWHVGQNILAAEGSSDWVFVERTTGRPMTVPPEMATAFLPDRGDGPMSRQPFPPTPPLPEAVFPLRRRVAFSEVDMAGHLNNAVYLTYMEDCAIHTAASLGWSVERMVEEGGFAIVAREYHIEYLAPALLHDEVEIVTWVSNVRRATALRHYAVTRCADNAPLARAYAQWVWVDVQSGRPIRLPADFMADFAPNITDG